MAAARFKVNARHDGRGVCAAFWPAGQWPLQSVTKLSKSTAPASAGFL
ncbi:unnamed protein product [Ciceribacter sp. T2.26MG-112.2]|nr:unnamed protein product [Ciceribacter naphthalenivorans]